MKQNINIIENKENTDGFVGIKINKEEQIEFYLPLGINKNIDNINKIIFEVLQSIRVSKKYFNENNLGGENKKENNFPLWESIELIKDFFENGYYIESEKIYQEKNSGKINWNKTFKRYLPIYSNNNFIYNKYVVKKNNINEDNIITKIHQYCIYLCSKIVLPLFGVNIKIEKPNIEYNKELFIQKLKEKRNQTFNDNLRIKLNIMIDIIENLNQEGTNFKFNTYGTNKYYYVWEKMLFELFNCKQDLLKKYYPFAKWNKLENRFNVEASKMRPDIIYIDENNMYIIDAKYYKYGIKPNIREIGDENSYTLPGTSDINKQITYGEYAEYINKKENLNKQIINLFIIPASLEDKYIEYLTFAEDSWRKDLYGMDRSYYKIYTIKMDMLFVLENYLKSTNKDALRYIEKINNLINNYLINNYLENNEKVLKLAEDEEEYM